MLKRKLCELWDDLHRKKNYVSCGPQFKDFFGEIKNYVSCGTIYTGKKNYASCGPQVINHKKIEREIQLMKIIVTN